jgi:2-hydroxy-3-oxopropionate reductase
MGSSEGLTSVLGCGMYSLPKPFPETQTGTHKESFAAGRKSDGCLRVGTGAGGFTKLVNQIIVALNIAAVGESFSLGVKAGLEPQAIYQAIRGGLAGSSVLDAKAPAIMARNFTPGFKIRLHLKDLNNALSTAKDLDLPLPLTGIAQQILISLLTNGRGDLDHSAIATFFENIGGVEIKQNSR